nr:LysE family transporter [Bacteroidales bacterium]
YWQDVVTTFALTISNPLAVFTFLIIFTSFDVFVEAQEKSLIYVVLIGVFIGALLWWINLTLLVGLFRRYINIRRLWWINKISGASIAVIALGIVVYAFF